MSGRALLLVLAAAMAHAGWNALAKRAHDPLVFLWSSVSLASLGLTPLGIWALMGGGWAPGGAPFVAATVGIHAVYFFALGRAYATGDLSLVYPVARGLGVALVPLLAFVFLDERLSAVGALGIVLVVAGIIQMGVFSRAPRAAAMARAPAVRLPRERGPLAGGLGWAILTGLSVAAYSVVDKAGVALVHPLAYISLMGIGMSAALAPVIVRRRAALAREWRTNGRAIALASTMNLTSYLLVLFAFRLSKVGYVVAAREISIVLSVVIGSVLMREGHVGPRLAGAAVVLGGVACVALAR
jgi:drug/metabolite transporter (DMT)-like permease